MTESERQNIRGLLAVAERVGGADLKRKVWEQVPHHTRMMYNYSGLRVVVNPDYWRERCQGTK